jgi:hypothetical protein
VVSRLVERGLVARGRSPADRRRVALRLTARGDRLVDTAPDVSQARLIRAIERLPASHRRVLARALGELTRAMDVAGNDVVMFFHADDRRPARSSGRYPLKKYSSR